MDNSEKLTLYSLFKQVQNGDAENHMNEYETQGIKLNAWKM